MKSRYLTLYICTALLFLGAAIPSLAQDTIYMKNGNIIPVKIKKSTSNSTYYSINGDSTKYYLPTSKIDSIYFHNNKNISPSNRTPSRFSFQIAIIKAWPASKLDEQLEQNLITSGYETSSSKSFEGNNGGIKLSNYKNIILNAGFNYSFSPRISLEINFGTSLRRIVVGSELAGYTQQPTLNPFSPIINIPFYNTFQIKNRLRMLDMSAWYFLYPKLLGLGIGPSFFQALTDFEDKHTQIDRGIALNLGIQYNFLIKKWGSIGIQGRYKWMPNRKINTYIISSEHVFPATTINESHINYMLFVKVPIYIKES